MAALFDGTLRPVTRLEASDDITGKSPVAVEVWATSRLIDIVASGLRSSWAASAVNRTRRRCALSSRLRRLDRGRVLRDAV
ncbi:hypothetical protein [Lentzea guizhouensis]|uniref:hypothetical protein n=1 Tax=Lentzea guizhouensis TaxID=1586287 RepID=UPI0012B69E2F|nr:hypothetical protein [Lentzea guizhouensis]